MAGNTEIPLKVSLGWLQNCQYHDGSNLTQINEIDKVACAPCLTYAAVELLLSVRNLVLLNAREFGPFSLVSSFGVIHQSCDTLKFVWTWPFIE